MSILDPIDRIHSAAQSRSGLLDMQPFGDLTLRAALDAKTKKDAFRLRHLCYFSKGYIDAQPGEEFSDPYDADPANTTFVVYARNTPVGSMRVCRSEIIPGRAKAGALPLAETFPDELQAFVGNGARIVEHNRLVCHPAFEQNHSIVFSLMRAAAHAMQQYNPDFTAACVRTNHVGFWKRLRFEYVAGPRLYKGLKFETNFLAVRRERYDMVQRMVPLLNINAVDNIAYTGLMRGETVRVFGHA